MINLKTLVAMKGPADLQKSIEIILSRPKHTHTIQNSDVVFSVDA